MKPYRIVVPSIVFIAAAALAASTYIHTSHAAASPQSRVSSLSPRERANTSRPRHEKNTVGEGAPAARVSLAQLPMVFEANRGQTDARVKFLARGNGYTLFIAPTAAVLTLRSAEKPHPALADSRHPLPSGEGKEKSLRSPLPLGRGVRGEVNTVAEQVLRIELVGANTHPQIAGLDALPGKANYFIGNDPNKWHTNIPTYAKAEMKNVYPGIDLIYYGGAAIADDLSPRSPLHEWRGDGGGSAPSPFPSRFPRPRLFAGEGNHERGRGNASIAHTPAQPTAHHAGEGAAARSLEYDFIVAPNANPNAIRLSFKGDRKPALNRNGDLIVSVGDSQVIEHAPVIYQEIAGRRHTIAGGWRLHGAHEAVFKLARYDRTKPLTIDPGLVYSTYLGGSGFAYGSRTAGDAGYAIAVDSAGNAYVTGFTASTDFPTTRDSLQTSGSGSSAFVAKFNPSMLGPASLVYSTYLGDGVMSGYEWDVSHLGIAVDSSGDAYVTGADETGDFPTTPGAFQRTMTGGLNAFVTKLNPSGSALVYSTYLGGSEFNATFYVVTPGDTTAAIAVDSSGNAYVTGTAQSQNFPTTANAFQATNNNIYREAEETAFVTKLNSTGSGLLYSTYLGGSGGVNGQEGDDGYGIAVDSAGNVYVVGGTASPDFPVTTGAFQTVYNGYYAQFNAFLAKLNPAASGAASLAGCGKMASSHGFSLFR